MTNFKKIRKEHGVIQAEVAKSLGITRAAYTNIENGRREADYNTLLKLSNLFECSVDYLLGHTTISPSASRENKSSAFLLENYSKLNQQGRKRLLEYSNDLVSSGRYAPDVPEDTIDID